MARANPRWMPDWTAMMRDAPEIEVPGNDGFVYIIADSHLGEHRSSVDEFLAMLETLADACMVIFLGDLFRVWLALPKFWDHHVREILDGFERLKDHGTKLLFVVGNREFFLPQNNEGLSAPGLPFDHVITGACVVTWGQLRFGLTHGDLVNRRDRQYLKWRRISRSRLCESLFRMMPGPMARRISERMERALANTNADIKIQYPADELAKFAECVLVGLDGFFIGHFHRDETIPVPGIPATLRIVPDWFSQRAVLRMDSSGALTRLS